MTAPMPEERLREIEGGWGGNAFYIIDELLAECRRARAAEALLLDVLAANRALLAKIEGCLNDEYLSPHAPPRRDPQGPVAVRALLRRALHRLAAWLNAGARELDDRPGADCAEVRPEDVHEAVHAQLRRLTGPPPSVFDRLPEEDRDR